MKQKLIALLLTAARRLTPAAAAAAGTTPRRNKRRPRAPYMVTFRKPEPAGFPAGSCRVLPKAPPHDILSIL